MQPFRLCRTCAAANNAALQTETEMTPLPGKIFEAAPGLRGLLADNPSPMTGRGTISWIVGEGDVALVDPGPEDAAHARALREALGRERITTILVTHAHRDHSGLARHLAQEWRAPVLAFGDATAGRSPHMAELAARAELPQGEGTDAGFRPDVTLADGEIIEGRSWRLEALHTPGHFGNHLCFAMGRDILCGDLAMAWSTTIVAPPDGDVAQYLASLRRLAARAPARLLPAHGAAIDRPAERIAELISHRGHREAQILATLATGPANADTLARRIYTDIPTILMGAASMNVLAHLVDLAERNLVSLIDPPSRHARFERSATR